MLVRVCPKCGYENMAASTSCSKCYTAIEGVEATAGTRKEPVLPPSAPRPKAPRTAQPTVSMPAGSQPTVSIPAGHAPTQQVPARPYVGYRYPQADAEKKGSNAWAIAIVLFVLLAAGGIGAYFALQPKPLTPEQQVRHAMEALDSNNWDEVKSHMTKATLDWMIRIFGSEERLRSLNKANTPEKALTRLFGGGSSSADQIKSIRFEGKDKSIVELKMPEGFKAQMRAFGIKDMKIETVFLREGEDFKLDLPQTEQQMLSQVQGMIARQTGRRPPAGAFPFPQPRAGSPTPPTAFPSPPPAFPVPAPQ